MSSANTGAGPTTPSRARAGTGTSKRSRPSGEARPAAIARTTTYRDLTSASGLYNAGKDLLHAEIPTGMWSATGQKTGSAPTLPDIRKGHYMTDQDDRARHAVALPGPVKPEPKDSNKLRKTLRTSQQDREPGRLSQSGRTSRQGRLSQSGRDLEKGVEVEDVSQLDKVPTVEEYPEGGKGDADMPFAPGSNELHLTKSGHYPNGYKFPPKHTWQESMKIGTHAFFKFVFTPIGFLMTVYALNVVGWGAMIFFLLIGAATPEMCFVQRPYGSGHYVKDCNDLYCPRMICIEIDSQVLTALFCLTAFGLVPWRARDLYFLIKWRVFRQKRALRRLGGWHSKWIRLPGSNHQSPTRNDNPEVCPEPFEKAPAPPLTGVRARPTGLWRLDFFIWMQVLNTAFQVVLCVFMWGENRFKRPSWATGCFVALGCVVAGIGGIVQFAEGKRIKQIEGVPLEVADHVEKSASRTTNI